MIKLLKVLPPCWLPFIGSQETTQIRDNGNMSILMTARFSDTVAKLSQLERGNPHGLAEVAFAGRSNAGKSSCINVLCNQKRLAYSSRTPGRTQALNLFAVGPVRQPLPIGFLVDTPGYGFATASLQAKKSWQALAGDYMTSRQPLTGIVLMIDIRRGLTDMDRQLISWIPGSLPLILVLTKADKLSRQQGLGIRRSLLQDPLVLGREGPVLLQIFSALHRYGLEPLRASISSLLTGSAAEWAFLTSRYSGPYAPIILKTQGSGTSVQP